MANSIIKTVLADGLRNLVLLVTITGDGSGDETNTALVTRSSFADTTGTKLVLNRVQGALAGFTAQLIFDATTKLAIAKLPDGQSFNYDWHEIDGIAASKAGAGNTGNLLITTSGLGSGESGTFTLFMRKGVT